MKWAKSLQRLGSNMHSWDDKDVDWKGINAAADYIGEFCRKWGRLGGQSKEKYGTVRFYVNFRTISLHSIFLPGYYHYAWFPKWLIKLDLYYISPILNTLFGRIVFEYQHRIYNLAYTRALKKWPHLQGEILTDVHYPEYLPKHHRVEGNKTHLLDTEGKIVSTWERL